VLGSMMDSQFRRDVSLAVSEDNFLQALLVRPITLILLALTVAIIVSNIPGVKRLLSRVKKPSAQSS
jgi:TctA family transporter